MKRLADGLHQLRGTPPNAINVYLMGTVLVDSASRFAGRRILSQLEGKSVTAHALTHAHPDHQGASARVCRTLGIPYWVGREDVAAAESGDLAAPGASRRFRASAALFAGPGHPVDRVAEEGDEIGGFTVLHTPGHSAGHVAFWRELDRTLVAGDVLFGVHPLLGIPGPHEPPGFFTPDPALNRESIRRLAALEPALVVFGHGPPLRDPERLAAFAADLPG